MGNADYSTLFGLGLLFVLGLVALLISGAITITRPHGKFGNQAAYYFSGIGGLGVIFSISEIILYLWNQMFPEILSGWMGVRMLLSSLVAILLLSLLLIGIRMWVQRRSPESTFPPIRPEKFRRSLVEKMCERLNEIERD